MSQIHKSKPPLRCGIIGAGLIGWRYDGGIWDGERSLSHAACIARHPQTQLAMICDPFPEARATFSAAHPDVATCKTVQDLLDADLDLITIASSSEAHAEQILACLRAGTPRLFIEKPVTTKLHDYVSLQDARANLPTKSRCVVNYFRRYLAQYQSLKDFVRSGQQVTGIALTYSRKLDTNGVHLLDILGFLCDASAPPALDWMRSGPNGNPSFGLTLQGIPVSVIGHDLPYHSIDVVVTAETGRMSVTRGGLDLLWEPMVPNPDYVGFFHLAPPEKSAGQRASDMRNGTYLAFCDLLEETPARSDLISAYFAQALMAQVLEPTL